MNYKMTCIYDDMTVIIENGVEISRTHQDNRSEYVKQLPSIAYEDIKRAVREVLAEQQGAGR